MEWKMKKKSQFVKAKHYAQNNWNYRLKQLTFKKSTQIDHLCGEKTNPNPNRAIYASVSLDWSRWKAAEMQNHCHNLAKQNTGYMLKLT